MKSKKLSPGAERLRQAIKDIYSPIDWSKQGITFDTPASLEMQPPPSKHHSARAAAILLGVSLPRVLRAVHRGIVRPEVQTGRVMGFSDSQVEILRSHLTPSKTEQ